MGVAAAASSSSRSCPPSALAGTSTLITGTSASAAPFAPCSSSGPAHTSSADPESRSTYAISSLFSSACTGTTTPPSASTA
jgi:hypothetical protein